MEKYDMGLNGAPDINTFVNIQSEKLKKCEQTFSSVFEFMFMLEDNVMAEYNDGNKIFSVTYGQCKSEISALSAKLAKKLDFVPKGSIVGLHMDNSVQWIVLFWSILRCGFKPLLMNKRLGEEVLNRVLEQNDVKAVVSDDLQFCVPTFEYGDIDKIKASDALADDCWADQIIFMSSGTSGKVKLCVYTGENICNQIYNARTIVESGREIQAHVEGKIKQLTFLPFYHVFGFLACYLWFAFFARTFVFLANFNSDTILKTVRKHKVTHIFAVPMLWTKIEEAAKKQIAARGEKLKNKFNRGLSLSNKLGSGAVGRAFAKKAFVEVREKIFGDSIRFMISGGGAISRKTLEFFNGIGYRLVNGFGMTEVGITSVELSSKNSLINSGTVGSPFDSVEYSEIDGELAVRGKSMASFIITDGEWEKTSPDQWFMTGDRGNEINGKWYVSGRKDDMIVTASGENVYPETVENNINIPEAEWVLLGIKDGDGSVSSQLIVSVRNRIDLGEVEDEVRTQLENNQMFRVVDGIKLTRTPLLLPNEFKLNRRRLREDIQSGRIVFWDRNRVAVADTDVDYIKHEIILAFEKALGRSVENTQYDSNFFYDLNGSSLGYFEVIEIVKAKFGINLLAEKSKAFYSVNDIYDYIKEKKSKVNV